LEACPDGYHGWMARVHSLRFDHGESVRAIPFAVYWSTVQEKLMAESKPASHEKSAAPAQESSRGSLTMKLLVLAFVLAVIVTECLVAYLLIPAASSSEVLAGATAPSPRDKAVPKDEKKDRDKDLPAEQVEVDLGEFTVTAFQPTSNSTLRLALHLYGTVPAADTAEFAVRMKDAQHRFREAVIVTLRGAEVSDLTDAGLGLLKRTILEKTNAMLGKPLLKMVIFSDFSFVEL
jgi:flagellar FliL protein